LSKPFNPVLLKARVGASLEKKRLRDEVRAHLRRIEEELESARQLQLGMVPSVFPRPTPQRPIEIFAMMEPAREVGGDLYDFFETDDGVFCFFIGDVSGKGVASALFMARAKNLIRLVTRLLRGANCSVPTPADIVTTVNRELCQDNTGMMFVTLFFGMLNPRTGDLRFTNAGHNPPYRLNGNEVTAIAGSKGHPLGVHHNSIYENGQLTLAAGDSVYLYTDGVTEAFNKKGDLFTEERLEAVLRATTGYRPDDLIKGVDKAVRDFADGAPQSDDITALALRRVT
jgi:sigma-B regulation protein RsbU (phosphoserine phosphatase)